MATPATTITSSNNNNTLITTPRLHLIPPDPDSAAHADFIVHLYNTPEFIASIGGKPTSITTRDAARAYIRNRFVAEHARNGYGTYLVVLRLPVPRPGESIGNHPGPDIGTSTGTNTTGGGSEAEAAANAVGGGEDNALSPGAAEAGKIVGTVSLSRGPPGSGYAAPDLGFAVLPEFCRQGIATEASRGLLAWWSSSSSSRGSAVQRQEGDKGGANSKGGGGEVVLGLHDPGNLASAAVLKGLGFEKKGLRRLSFFGGVVGMVWTMRVGGGGGSDGTVSEDEVRALGLPGEEEVVAQEGAGAVV
ncbi:GNAT domain-containing protein [Microdochium trichocladiopsis]|uniref:GNAT domain-containing protein n=1 Tax=Microdochium trichocladiopsis TaxID=1682393 RepID=A0A9P9BKB3_9PEZI|nr:GNAT domain-containing protein [Microdochium trichocladiopsis]KAH7021011.1 GNAT domain-containing protein [Microdochium trichocladiopsis]